MPELLELCEGPVSTLSGAHLQMGSLAPPAVALAPSPPTMESSQAFVDEESAAPDTTASHSTEFNGQVVPMGDDVVPECRCLTSVTCSPSSLMISLLEILALYRLI